MSAAGCVLSVHPDGSAPFEMLKHAEVQTGAFSDVRGVNGVKQLSLASARLRAGNVEE